MIKSDKKTDGGWNLKKKLSNKKQVTIKNGD